jgi:hypothetical protein
MAYPGFEGRKPGTKQNNTVNIAPAVFPLRLAGLND